MSGGAGQGTVTGIVLAAGRSTRMGRPKPLLDLSGRTFLRVAVETLRAGGCADVVVVAGSSAADEEARAAGARVVQGRPAGEQIDSLRAGLDAVPAGTEAVLVLPVDHPLVRAETVGALLRAASRAPAAVVRPVHDGRPGHPTLFPRVSWPALRDRTLPQGARSVVAEADERVDVPVADAGIHADLDTPEDYRRHVGAEP